MTEDEFDRKLERLAIRGSEHFGGEHVIDRLLTLGAAHIATANGSAECARVLRELAANVEAGALRNVDPTARRKC
jgi:hypothetical protein